MKLLLTGGAGFIGRWVLRTLPASVDVVVVDRLEPEVHGPHADFPPDVAERAHCVRADLRDPDAWAAHALDADAVIHLAALTGTAQSGSQLSRYTDQNVTATARLLDAIATRSARPGRLVLASSRAVYGEGAYVDSTHARVCPSPRTLDDLSAERFDLCGADQALLTHVGSRPADPARPASVYGLTKLWQEQLCALSGAGLGVQTVVLRLQNVYGPLQALRNPYTGILGLFTQRILSGRSVELFEDGEMRRDFVHVRDVAHALWTCASAERVPSVADVGSGVPTTLRALVDALARATGRPATVMCSGRFRTGDVRHALADMSATPAPLLPWTPTPLDEGLSEYVRWVTEQTPVTSDVYDRQVLTGVRGGAVFGSES